MPPKPPEKHTPTPARTSNKGTAAAAPAARTSTRNAPAASRPPPPPVEGTEEFETFEEPDRPTAQVDISEFMEEGKAAQRAAQPPPPPSSAPRRASKPELPAAAPRKPTRGEMAAAAPVPAKPASGSTPPPARKPTRGEVAAQPAAGPATPARKPTRGEVPAAAAPAPTPSKPARPAPAKPAEGSDEVTEAAGGKDKDKLKLQTTNPKLRALESKARRFAIVVVGLSALVVGGVAAGAYFVLANDRPEDGDLRLAYPYGFQGKRGPKGEVAPGAGEVHFKLVGEIPACGDHTKCLRYRYTGGDGFSGTMLLGKTRDKQWERVGEEGMPFEPATEEGL